MECQNLFSGENKKNSTSLSSAELAQRMVKIECPKYAWIYGNNTVQILITLNSLDLDEPYTQTR